MTTRWKIHSAVTAAATWSLPIIASATDVSGVQGLVRANHAVELPGVGRVIGSLLLVLAVGVAIAIALRRLQPKWTQQVSGGKITVVDRIAVGGVRVYLLLVDERKVLITEHKNSTSCVLLPAENRTDGAAAV